jgi:VCBS repeat-containing protein
VFHTRGETFDVRDGAAAIAVEPDSVVVTIPDAHFLFTADFKRKGPDLVLTGEDGRKVLVTDYFRHEKQPDLVSSEGALLSANLVEILAGSRAPGQYAQDGQAGAAAAPAPIGRVETLTGSASAVRNGVAIELNVGDLIFQGDVVQTRTDSTLAIAFSDGSAFTLNENARMVLNEFVYDPNSTMNSAVINLVQGTVSFIAAQVAKTGNMRVETPTATMGIRGTFVTVSVSSVDGHTVASLGMETDSSGRQYSGAFSLTNRITGNQVTVSDVASMYSVSPAGSISESAKPPAIAAIEAATFQALVPVIAAAANFGPTGPAQGPTQGQNQNDQSSQSTSSTGSQSSGSGGSSGSSAPTTPDKVTVPLTTTTTTTTDQTAASQTNTTGTTTTTTGTVVTQTTDNTPHVTPAGTVTNVSDTETASSQLGSFNIMSQVSVANPGSPTAYAGGSAALVSATASGGVPPAFINAPFLSSLVSIAPDGTVHYDNSKFSFLAAGQSLSYTINFDVQSGSDTLHLSLTFTVTGINEAPTITFRAGDAASATITDDTHATTLSTTGTLSFKDADASDGHLVSVALKSGHSIGTFVAGVIADTTGADTTDARTAGDIGWIFAPNKAQAQALAAGETDTEVYTITLSDGHGGTTSQDVAVTVVGVNDAPTIVAGSTTATGVITEDAHASGHETASGTIAFKDVDLNDTHTVSASGPSFVWKSADNQVLTLSPSQIAELTSLDHSSLTLVKADSTGTGTGSVAWMFNVADSAIDFLAQGETLSVIYNVTVTDNNGATTTQPLMLTVAGTGTNDAPVIIAESTTATGTITELADTTASSAPDSVSGTIAFQDVDLNDSHTASKSFVSAVWQKADATTASLSDPGVLTLGTLDDTSKTVAWSHTTTDGALDFLAAGEKLTVTYNVTIDDGHGGTATQPVTVTIHGTNDAAVITGASTAALTETNAAQSTGGTLSATDVDSSAAFVAQTDVAGSNGFGKFSIGTDGVWTYTMNNAHNEFVGGTDYTDSITVATADGTTQAITVTIHGTNDAAVITGASTAALTETNAAQSTGGTLSATDVDSSAAFVAQTDVAGSNGFASSRSAPTGCGPTP